MSATCAHVLGRVYFGEPDCGRKWRRAQMPCWQAVGSRVLMRPRTKACGCDGRTGSGVCNRQLHYPVTKNVVSLPLFRGGHSKQGLQNIGIWNVITIAAECKPQPCTLLLPAPCTAARVSIAWNTVLRGLQFGLVQKNNQSTCCSVANVA